MGFLLREGLSFCRVLDRFVFLDLVHDRYFCLGQEAGSAFAAMLSGHGQAASSWALEGLVDGGLIVPVAADVLPRQVELPRATGSLLRKRDMNSRSEAFEALWRRSMAELWLGTRGLDASVARIKRIAARGKPRAGQELAAAASAAIAASSLWRSTAGRCVPVSMATIGWLSARQRSASFVIGVKLHPFEAHCWVQTGDLLVNDEFDRIRPFEPILVV